MDIIQSINNIPIRLTSERWVHIIENHDDLAGYYDIILGTVEDPDFIIEGYQNALIAIKEISGRKFLAVVYKEITRKDGFIITAYFTNKLELVRKKILWKKY